MPLGPRAHRQSERLAAALDGAPAAGAGTAALLATADRVRALPLTVPARTAGGRDSLLAAFTAGHAALAPPAGPAPSGQPVAGHGAAGHRTAGHRTAGHRTADVRAAGHGAAGTHTAGSGLLAGHGLLVPIVGGIAAVALAAGTVTAVVRSTHDGRHPAPTVESTAGARGTAALQAALGALAQIQALARGPVTAASRAEIAALVDTLDGQLALATRDLLAGTPAQVAALLTTLDRVRAGLAALPPLGGVAAAAVARSQALLTRLTSVLRTTGSTPSTGPSGTGPARGGAPGQVSGRPGTTGPSRPPVTATRLSGGLPTQVSTGPSTGLPTHLPTRVPSEVSSILTSLLPTVAASAPPTPGGLPPLP